MGLKDLSLMSSYETSSDRKELLERFYIPVLEQAKTYYRIAGFFSSTALTVAAKGIEGLIRNGGSMCLLVSPVLSQDDYNTLVRFETIDEHSDLFKQFSFEENANEHVQALAWLLSQGLLTIKIVVPKRNRDSIFHQKIGIIVDEEENILSFSGSINETAQAWLENIEEFKVFRSWNEGQAEYLQSDLNKFTNYWNNTQSDIAAVFDIPEAIKKRLIQIRPRDINDLNIMRRYQSDIKLSNNKLSLFPHQKNAVQSWQNNDYALLIEMATGTGKTRTAIGCIASKLEDKETLLVIVATPQNTLSRQWMKEFVDLDIVMDANLIIDGSNPRWRKDLKLLLNNLQLGIVRNAVIFTTHDTSSKEDFTKAIINKKYDTKILYVCDEVHAAGSGEQKKALLDVYDYRIGLSATPERMYDKKGTSIIREYFGNKSFEFTIADALSTINPLTGKPFLNEYEYHPVFVNLTSNEYQEYAKFTKQITYLASLEVLTSEEEEKLKTLLLLRARICKNATNKMAVFSALIKALNPETLNDTIVFASEVQMESVFSVLTENNIKRAKITESESATKKVNKEGETERQEIISQFKRHELQVLVGIKCLDEGIDIKNARIAILLSSSTNPREFIQRVGRVIRVENGKDTSHIYDLVVVPPYLSDSSILEREAKRAYQIAVNAKNYNSVKQQFLEYGVHIDANK